MKVSEIMVRTAATCRPDMNLGEAVEIMWNRNCGILPIVDRQGKVTGVITDRDICIAMGTRNQLPGQIRVEEVRSKQVHYCGPEDDVSFALQIMASAKVRRLPVLNSAGKLEGILSIDDVISHADTRNLKSQPGADKVIETLRAVYSPNLPQRVMSDRAA